jgi:protein associated with RNAse G/E
MTAEPDKVTRARDDDGVTVESRKFDGRLHRSWRTRLVERRGALVVLDGTFAEEVKHALLGRIPQGTRSVEHYWEDRWYSVFRFHDTAGALRYFYCNVNTPPTFDGRLLSFTDLDIDILVMPDFTYTVLDLDEFEDNSRRLAYPEEVRAGARRATRELISLIESRRFPFDSTEL